MNSQIILGISAFYHDSAAALIKGGEIIAAAEEERFTRVKHTRDFPVNAINYCLKEGNITLNEVDTFVFYDKPLLKFERILETAYLNAPYGFPLFHKAIPVWLKKKVNLRKTIRKELKELSSGVKVDNDKIHFTTHHFSHAASAYYPSPYNEAAILIIDGVGEWATATIGKGEGNKIRLLKQMNYPNSVGLLYSAFTLFLGFKVNSGEYKLMGLSPYGNRSNPETKEFIRLIKENLVEVFDDGSIEMNSDYFYYSRGMKMIRVKKWEKLFGIKLRRPTANLKATHANLAMAIQKVTEEIILKLAKTTHELTGCENLVLAGGVALNCVANGLINDSEYFKRIWIQPAAGDSGGALGAALAVHYFNQEQAGIKQEEQEGDDMRHSLLGPKVNLNKIHGYLEGKNYTFELFKNHDLLCAHVTDLLISDQLIGWVQGRLEFGPRALGARSIIASPFKKQNQTRINKAVKFREDFRPFAPVMLKEEAVHYYDFQGDSSYMQMVKKIKPEFRYELPDMENMLIEDRVKIPTSKLEAVTHIDHSSRLQVVADADHPFYQLLLTLKEKTGTGILINTSFNRAGEPIVTSLNDIFGCFEETDLDYLVIDKYVIKKSEKE